MEQAASFTLRFVIVVVLLSGCHSPLPNPESLDSLYGEYVGEQTKSEKAELDERANIESLKADLLKMAGADPSRRRIFKMIKASERNAVHLHELTRFYELRAETRRAQDIDEYSKVFGTPQEEKWPSNSDFHRYKTQRKLQDSSRNWADRVPKPISTTVSKGEKAKIPKKEGVHEDKSSAHE